MTTFESARIQTAARGVGIAQAALEEALAYAQSSACSSASRSSSSRGSRARSRGWSVAPRPRGSSRIYAAQHEGLGQALRSRGGDGQAPRDARGVGSAPTRACRSMEATATPRSTRRAGSWWTRACSRSSRGPTRSRRTSSRAACSSERGEGTRTARGQMRKDIPVRPAPRRLPGRRDVRAPVGGDGRRGDDGALPGVLPRRHARLRERARTRAISGCATGRCTRSCCSTSGSRSACTTCSEQAIAHLAYIDVRFPSACFAGDTLHARRARSSASSSAARGRGVVHVRTSLANEDERVVCTFERQGAGARRASCSAIGPSPRIADAATGPPGASAGHPLLPPELRESSAPRRARRASPGSPRTSRRAT